MEPGIAEIVASGAIPPLAGALIWLGYRGLKVAERLGEGIGRLTDAEGDFLTSIHKLANGDQSRTSRAAIAAMEEHIEGLAVARRSDSRAVADLAAKMDGLEAGIRSHKASVSGRLGVLQKQLNGSHAQTQEGDVEEGYYIQDGVAYPIHSDPLPPVKDPAQQTLAGW